MRPLSALVQKLTETWSHLINLRSGIGKTSHKEWKGRQTGISILTGSGKTHSDPPKKPRGHHFLHSPWESHLPPFQSWCCSGRDGEERSPAVPTHATLDQHKLMLNSSYTRAQNPIAGCMKMWMAHSETVMHHWSVLQLEICTQKQAVVEFFGWKGKLGAQGMCCSSFMKRRISVGPKPSSSTGAQGLCPHHRSPALSLPYSEPGSWSSERWCGKCANSSVLKQRSMKALEKLLFERKLI